MRYFNGERVTTENCALSTLWSLCAPKLAGLLTVFPGLTRESPVVAFLARPWHAMFPDRSSGTCLPDDLVLDDYLG